MSVVYYPKVYFFYFCEEIVICAAFFDYRLQFEQSCVEGDLAHGGHAVKFDEVGMGASIDFDDGAGPKTGWRTRVPASMVVSSLSFLQEGGRSSYVDHGFLHELFIDGRSNSSLSLSMSRMNLDGYLGEPSRLGSRRLP